MKKPTRSPPPPPPPSRSLKFSSSSLAHITRSSCDNQSCAGSEYSEGLLSVQSVPHALIQRSYSPSVACSIYHSARSESGLCYSTPVTSRNCSRCCIPKACCATPYYQAPCCPCSTRSHQSIESPQPVPRERTSRPIRSISPMPTTKIDRQGQPKPRYKCESLIYRRHIEQHIERIFRYRKDRQGRLKQTLDECKSSNIDNARMVAIMKMLTLKETRYLRSLRTRPTPEGFEKIKLLGSGYMGDVWLVRNNFSDKPNLYAMKMLRKSQVYRQNHMAHVIAERDILAEANNEWIVELYYSFQDEKHLYFILEYIPGGDMMGLLIKMNVFPEHWAQFYIAEISLAVQFVHDMKFVHRDIKPDNILIDRNGHIKLTDFGLCRGNRWTHDLSYYRDDTFNNQNESNIQDEHPTITRALTERAIEHSQRTRALSLVGSPNYIAPEVLRQANQGCHERLCDWWSVGVILYEMVIGFCPFIDTEKLKLREYNPEFDPPERIQERIKNWHLYLSFPSPTDPNSPPSQVYIDGEPQFISSEAQSLIEGWLCEPQDRLCQNGIREVQDHPFFKGINWQNIRSETPPHRPVLSDPLDTSHFDIPPFARDGTMISGSEDCRKMNDFTYRNFWNQPFTDR